MGENNTYKVVSIIALIIGVIGVSLGYAAFSSTLTITSTATVEADENNFNIDFSTSSSSVVEDPIVPTVTGTGATATNATINNTSDPTVTNISATFTEPGQSATYSFYTYNAGLYIGYLNSLVFEGTKTCTASGTTTQALVDSACTGVTISATVGSTGPTGTSVASITNQPIAVGGNQAVTVVISYAAGSAIADGDFTVTFPDIVLTYDSAD